MFSATLLDHFENPRNAGELTDATVIARVENPVCADSVVLALRIEAGVVTNIRFLAKGCVPAIAATSLLTTMVAGNEIDDLGSITAAQVVEGLDGVPEGSSHAAQLAVDALKAALLEFSRNAAKVANHG